ncbi:hypothetical protein ES702_04080 [subsurface metagenome]
MAVRDKKGRFVEGSSGNPTGRPPERAVSEILREYLAEEDPKRKTERKKALCEKLYDMSMGGNIWAVKVLLAYSDGLPIQRLEGEFSADISNNASWVALRTMLMKFANKHPDIQKELVKILGGESDND